MTITKQPLEAAGAVRVLLLTRLRQRSPLPQVTVVPPNFGSRLIGLRLRLRLTQAELARRIGAANKAVVYRWESGKRTPSPAFWTRVGNVSAMAVPDSTATTIVVRPNISW